MKKKVDERMVGGPSGVLVYVLSKARQVDEIQTLIHPGPFHGTSLGELRFDETCTGKVANCCI